MLAPKLDFCSVICSVMTNIKTRCLSVLDEAERIVEADTLFHTVQIHFNHR